jgi:5'-nucleotidase/UDP-sugar diphosphatase
MMIFHRGWLAVFVLILTAGFGETQDHARTLTILHTNDLHARFLPDERGRGGFAALATAIERQRSSAEAVVVLNAGDLVQGTPVSSIYEGVPCYEVASALGIDVNTIGNHEFDYTWRRILDFFEAASFPTVSANVVKDGGDLLAEKPYVMLERGGLRIAVIGVLMERLDRLTRAHQRGPWRVLPAAATVRRYAREVRNQADVVVVLAHLFDEEEDEILRTVPEIDVLVGGHNHRGVEVPNVFEGRIGVKLRAYGVELGRLDLTISPERRVVSSKWKRIPVTTRAFAPDPAVQELVDKWEKKVSTVVDVPIGRGDRTIQRDEVRRMIEEAMADAVGADLAYMNAGGVRDSLPRGEILVRHVWNILPFGNRILHGRLRGRDLPRDMSEGHRIDPNKIYRVATNDFIVEQWGPRYQSGFTESGPLVREALVDYIKQRRNPQH